MPALTRECRRCYAQHRMTPTGRARAHRCPHGHVCVLSYAARRRGDKARRCPTCVEGRQLSLFADTGT